MSDWIDIKKILPPINAKVLVANRYVCDYDGKFPAEWHQSVYTTVASEEILTGKTNITHWMYMPAPPTI
jgi:hypothetical protein